MATTAAPRVLVAARSLAIVGCVGAQSRGE